MGKKVVLNENCKCWVTQQDLQPPVADFINNMANCGTYYNPCEQGAFNELYKAITETTGIKIDAVAFTGTDTKTLTLKFADLSELTASFEDLQGIQTINNTSPDPSGNLTIDAAFVGADPAGTAAGLMGDHIADVDPHTQYQLRSEKGQPNGYASLDGSGKLLTTQLPDLAVSDYLGTAANQAAMLALVGQKGDWAVRTDLGTTWIITGNDPTQLSSWTQLSYPTAPVTSVNLKTGAVTLNAADVGAAPASGSANYIWLQTTTPATQQTGNINISGKALIGGNTLIGTTTDNGAKLQVGGGVLSTAPLASPPTVINGGLYYDTALNKERIGVSGAWQNIATEATALVTGKVIIVDINAATATDTRTGINKYSESTPFSTLASANAVAVIGDTIEIRGGTNTVTGTITLNASILILNNAIVNSTGGINANDRIIKLNNGSSLTLASDLAVSGASNVFIDGDNTGKLTFNNATNGAGTIYIKNMDSITGTIQASNVYIDNVNSMTNNNDSYAYNATGTWYLKSVRAINRSSANGIFGGAGILTLDNCIINHSQRLCQNIGTITIKNGCKISTAEILGTSGAASLKMYNSEYTSSASLWQTETAGAAIIELINNKIKVGATFVFYSAAAASGIIVNNFSNATTLYRGGGPSPTSKLDTPNYLGITFL